MATVHPVTVFGNINVDVTLRIGDPYQDSQLFGLDRAMEIVGSRIAVKNNGYLSVPYEDGRLVFPLKGGSHGPGDKINTEDPVFEKQDSKYSNPTNPNGPWLSRGEWAWPLPGGGGPNVGRGLYRLFGRIERSLVATCSASQENTFRMSLGDVWGGDSHLVLIPVDTPHGVNVVVEGIGTFGERNIFRAPQARALAGEWKNDVGSGVVMVNSVYNSRVAIRALTEAMIADGAVIACTESLCASTPLSPTLSQELAAIVNERLQLKPPEALQRIESEREFLRTVVLRRARPKAVPPVWIFNETEFAKFLDTTIMAAVGGPKYILAYQLLKGFSKFRELERKPSDDASRSVAVVTCGSLGAFALDARDGVHYCSTLKLNLPVQEKNAIGDLFASVFLGVIAGGIRSRSHALQHPSPAKDGTHVSDDQLWVVHGLLAASAGADSGVYDGFRAVSVANVNSHLLMKAENYAYLGNLQKLIGGFGTIDTDLKTFVEETVLKLGPGKVLPGSMRPLSDLVDPNVLTS